MFEVCVLVKRVSSLVVYELAREHRDTLVSGSRSVAVKGEWRTTVVNIASLNTVSYAHLEHAETPLCSLTPTYFQTDSG